MSLQNTIYRKIQGLVCLLFLFNPSGFLFAQDHYPPALSVTPDLFEDGEVLSLTYEAPWFYKAGDDTDWADPEFIKGEFIHENWEETSHVQYLEYLEPYGTHPFEADGNVWFFKELKVDSTLYGESFAISGKMYGAMEVYLNGVKQGSAGIVADNRSDEVPRGYFLPISFELWDMESQYLAIRYSYQTLREIGPQFIVLGLILDMAPEATMEQHFEDSVAERSVGMAAQSFSMGASAVLGILLLFLYLMYPRQRLNLIAAILFLLIALSSIGIFFFTIWETPENFFTALIISGIGVSLSSFVNVWFAFKLIQKNKNWLFWTFLILSVFISLLTFYSVILIQNLSVLLWILSMIYVLVLFSQKRIKKGQKDLDVILIGFGIYFVGFITFLVLVITGTLPQTMVLWLSILSLLVPVSYSFYLARDVARTNELLSRKLDENQLLSDEKLRQEQKNKRLIESQKEKLAEEVKARTAELAEAYENLKKSHEELKNTQKQLIQQEKMASLGQLTAGIAHEIKNPLNFVNNFSEVSKELIEELREEIGSENEEIISLLDDIEANVKTINKHGKRADSIVHGMLLHSRGKSGEKMPTDINKLLDEYSDLAYHGLRAKDPGFNAYIEKELDERIGMTAVVPQELSRAFLNIINNGLQAANEYHKTKGTGEEVLIKISTKKTDGKIEIRISDNGPGIPDKIRKKIFEPFFTTKAAGEGTGLGLSMTYEIIEAHNGTINLISEKGEGTTFIITLYVEE